MSTVSKQEPKLETLTLFQKRSKTAFWEKFWGVTISAITFEKLY